MAWVTLIESDTETMQPLRPAKRAKKIHRSWNALKVY